MARGKTAQEAFEIDDDLYLAVFDGGAVEITRWCEGVCTAVVATSWDFPKETGKADAWVFRSISNCLCTLNGCEGVAVVETSKFDDDDVCWTCLCARHLKEWLNV